MASQAPSLSLCALSPDCLAHIVNNCQPSDVANVRASTKGMRVAVNASLRTLDPTTGDASAIAVLLGQLPALTHLSLGHRRGVFDGVTNYTRLADYVWCLTAELLRHTSLTSLSLSTDDLQRLGSLKWAHNVCSQQQGAAASSRSRSIWKWYKEEYAGFATDSQHQVYWLPNWLASPPGLQTLVIEPPTPGSHQRSSSSRVPACLWFNPTAWASKLQHLELIGVPVVSHLPPGLCQLTWLHTLGLVECCLQPDGLAQLLRQVARACVGLKSLLLSGNDLWQLPKGGWQALTGLQELDLSCNQLVTLPVGLSHLVSLTSLQLQHNQLDTLPAHLTSLQQLALLSVSHNWLSGFNNTPHFSQLVATWQQLRVLRLANVSDKRGSLVLPSQLGNCSLLSELCVGHNHDVDWGSLEVLLDKCQSLQLLDLSGVPESSLPASLRSKLGLLQHRVKVDRGKPQLS